MSVDIKTQLIAAHREYRITTYNGKPFIIDFEDPDDPPYCGRRTMYVHTYPTDKYLRDRLVDIYQWKRQEKSYCYVNKKEEEITIALNHYLAMEKKVTELENKLCRRPVAVIIRDTPCTEEERHDWVCETLSFVSYVGIPVQTRFRCNECGKSYQWRSADEGPVLL